MKSAGQRNSFKHALIRFIVFNVWQKIKSQPELFLPELHYLYTFNDFFLFFSYGHYRRLTTSRGTRVDN